jgi:hypothetical protein
MESLRNLVAKHYALSIAFVAFAVAFLICAVSHCQVRPTSSEATGAWMTASPQEVDAGIQHILRKNPRHHLMVDYELRAAYAQDIVTISRAYDVPPLLTAEIVFHESSFDEKAIGARGELGLMQVAKGNVAFYKCDMGTAHGQIECGARMMHAAFVQCGSWYGALTRYATTKGLCASPEPTVQAKINIRLRDWQRTSIAIERAMREQGDEE